MIGIKDLTWREAGLIPAVVQDAFTGEVLTLAYVSPESLERTREIGETVFFSRSRKVLWHKGETSGHYQKVAGVTADCDKDAIVIRVRPLGPACHTGARSCFFQDVDGFPRDKGDFSGTILADLEQVIADRQTRRPEGSYTAELFNRGRKQILQKVSEEAAETVRAGMKGDREEMMRETSDLLYHLLVAMREMGVSLEEVAAELRARRK